MERAWDIRWHSEQNKFNIFVTKAKIFLRKRLDCAEKNMFSFKKFARNPIGSNYFDSSLLKS